MIAPREAWQRAYSAARRLKGDGQTTWRQAIAPIYGVTNTDELFALPGRQQIDAIHIQQCLANLRRPQPSLAERLAYDVLNHFGTLNPFCHYYEFATPRWRRGDRARRLRERMRERGLLTIEPGGYVSHRGVAS